MSEKEEQIRNTVRPDIAARVDKARQEDREAAQRIAMGLQHRGKMSLEVTEPERALPIHDSIERRAIVLRLAIESKPVFFDAAKLAVPGPAEYADHIITVARRFEEYVTGESAA